MPGHRLSGHGRGVPVRSGLIQHSLFRKYPGRPGFSCLQALVVGGVLAAAQGDLGFQLMHEALGLLRAVACPQLRQDVFQSRRRRRHGQQYQESQGAGQKFFAHNIPPKIIVGEAQFPGIYL